MLSRTCIVLALIGLVGCAPTTRQDPPDPNGCPGADLNSDRANCGSCGHACASTETCSSGQCLAESCDPGKTVDCYGGAAGTKDVGPCRGGQRTCDASGNWGSCVGEVLPGQELCGNGLDDNCSGQVDEDVDNDGDGFSTCEGDCCDSTSECASPGLVNPGAFEAPGNTLDDDCDGTADNVVAANCDTGLASNSGNAMDYAKAIDLCQTATETDGRWGVISAKWSLADGSGTPNNKSCSIRPAFGTNLTPRAGAAVAEISTGHAADTNDTNPPFHSFDQGGGLFDPSLGADMLTSSGYPADWLSLNSNNLPNAPGCPDPAEDPLTGQLPKANDPVMLTLRIRTPSNAQSFSLSTNFYSAEYPEYVCTPFNDFFVVLLDSTWDGTPANPPDKNLASYTAPNGAKYPVGVNLAHGNTGLFTQCMNGATGCSGGVPGNSTVCQATDQLAGTGFDGTRLGSCDTNSLAGGATGWLTTSGNVKGGEIITLRIAIWDTSDHAFDSLAVLDNFQWNVTASDPGTVID